MNRHFLNAFIDTIDLMPYSTGTAQPKLNRDSCEMIKIPVPARDEQDKIASMLQAVDGRCTEETKRLTQLTQTKTAISQALLTGRVRVRMKEVGRGL